MPNDHYVSQFHLREFCDPSSLSSQDPWLWVGNLRDDSVRRRSPKNIGSVPNLFAGPGGLSDPTLTIERFLANQVEGPAAPRLRALCAGAAPPGGNLPPIGNALRSLGRLSIPCHATLGRKLDDQI
jgi:Protein of unknown function (DUF4238)